MEMSDVIAERRSERDRRHFSRGAPSSTDSCGPGDTAPRREADGDVVFLDWHHPWLFFLSVGIMLLSCTDAFLTLRLIDHGMIEANPVMAAMMGIGTPFFAVSKILMTGDQYPDTGVPRQDSFHEPAADRPVPDRVLQYLLPAWSATKSSICWPLSFSICRIVSNRRNGLGYTSAPFSSP